MKDLLTLQEDLTTEISEKLRLHLTGEEKKRLRKRPAKSNEVFRLVLEAKYAVYKTYPESLKRGIALCERAIEIDPEYAPAYAELSTAFTTQDVLSYAPASEVRPRAQWAAQRALELDETLAEAHLSLGMVRFYGWDFATGEREMRRAVELNPNSAPAWGEFAFVCNARGRFEESIAAAKRALELDPFSDSPQLWMGIAHFVSRHFDLAAEHLQKGLELNSHNTTCLGLLAAAHAWGGQPEKALARCQEIATQAPGVTAILGHAGAAYAKIGKSEEARETLRQMETSWKPDGRSSIWIGAIYAGLGEKDAAFDWLEKAFQEHTSFLAYFKIHPLFENLHGDPRFDALVKRIGIPD